MASIFTRKFWRDAAERTISSTAQGFVTGSGLFGLAAATGQVDLHSFPWLAGLSGAAIMGLQTLAKCVLAANVGEDGTASLVDLDTPGRHAAPE